jgi:hypothetical protein
LKHPVGSDDNIPEEMKKIKDELKKMLELKECKIILNKYSSKFDITEFKTFLQ